MDDAEYQAFLLIASGVIAAVAMTLLTNAYRIAKVSVVTSFEYTGNAWALLWGYLFFGDILYLTTIAGAGLIIAAGMFALSSPSARGKQAGISAGWTGDDPCATKLVPQSIRIAACSR